MSRHSGPDLRSLRDPVVVVAFGGWNDGGGAASGVVDHLSDVYDATSVFELDPDDFYDFQVSRPQVHVPEADERVVSWPTTELKVSRLGDGRDLLLVSGIEPNFRWRQFTRLLVSALRSADVRRVYLLGALLADNPHTRPIPVSVTTRGAELADALGVDVSTYEGPTGILGVLGDELDGLGVEVISLWAAVPHYVSHPPCPKATLALLSRLEDLLDSTLEMGDLPELSKAWERGVDELAADDSEVADYVATLEEQRDTAELPEASGDAIAAEFERYLRRRQGG
ncbi:MAG: PAC2 family protein [Propionibacteriaceae bacterium]